jgi:ABC-type nitrate/sulfonate/bicarbonate transport system ATPase subunit
MTPLLSIERLWASRGDRTVLREMSLAVDRGEFVSILGPSGVGKSTLFDILIGDVCPSFGRIVIDGDPQARTDAAFAFMPQRDALLPWRSVIDNVALGLEIAGEARGKARERVRGHFAAFGLDGCEERFPDELSGGMRQRAALMRTVVQERPVMLLDEPFGALDALTRLTMQRWLEHHWLERRWTVLLVTHDVREAVMLSDRICVMGGRPGTVVAEFAVPLPRPRLDGPLDAQAVRLEHEILSTLLDQNGEQRC